MDKSTRYAWELGLQSLINTEQASRNLSAQLDLFLAEPSEASLANVRQEWRNCHQQWQQHAVWVALAKAQSRRFVALNRHYFVLDARELQPGYLDAVQDYPFSGIVNDISIVLTADSLRQQHGLTYPSEVSLGFHALEFPNNRRRTVLRLVNQVLADDVQRLRQDWQNPLSPISQTYQQLPPRMRLEFIQHTAHQLLGSELPDQLLQAIALDRTTHHNQFAGDTLQHNLAVLIGLEALLTQGESPLLSHLGGAAADPAWSQQLQSLIADLGELIQDKDGINTAKLSELLEQLPVLAAALATEKPAAE